MSPSAKTGRAYRDRQAAGKILAAHVRREISSPDDALVLALPRGGVPVGLEVALVLDAGLDVFVVRKLGVPGQEELAMGALAAGGFVIVNEPLVAELGITEGQISSAIEREAGELRRREQRYRGNRPPLSVTGRVVILVDDGLATGFSMRAAVGALQKQSPRRLVVAVPVSSVESCADLRREIDTVICPLQPEPFHAVGLWYRDFAATTDEEVCACLAAARASRD